MDSEEPKTQERCPRCLSEMPYKGGPIPVVSCDCGACACQGCVDSNRRGLGLSVPPRRQQAGGVFTPSDEEMRYHRATLSALVGSEGETAEDLCTLIRQVFGSESIAGLVTDVRVEEPVADPVHGSERIAVSVLVPVGWDGLGDTPEHASEWLRLSLREAMSDCDWSGPCDVRVDSLAAEPERGCAACFRPPAHIEGTDADGLCADCRDEREEEAERLGRVESLLSRWNPREHPSAAATEYGEAIFTDKPTLYGLIREFGPEGKRQLVALHLGTETVWELGDHTLADILWDFRKRPRHCGHDTDLATHACDECARTVRSYIAGLHRRPVC